MLGCLLATLPAGCANAVKSLTAFPLPAGAVASRQPGVMDFAMCTKLPAPFLGPRSLHCSVAAIWTSSPPLCCQHALCLVQETNQEVPGWLQGMGARAPSFGGGKRRGGGGNRFGGQDFRRDTGHHCEIPCS